MVRNRTQHLIQPRNAIPIPTRTQHSNRLTRNRNVFNVRNLVVAFFISVVNFVVNPRIFHPFNANHRVLVQTRLPIVLPFRTLNTNRVVIKPMHPLMVVRVTRRAQLNYLLLGVVDRAMIISRPISKLVHHRMPTNQVNLVHQAITIVILVVNFRHRQHLIHRILIRPRKWKLLKSITTKVIHVNPIEGNVMLPLFRTTTSGPTHHANPTTINRNMTIRPPKTNVNVRKQFTAIPFLNSSVSSATSNATTMTSKTATLNSFGIISNPSTKRANRVSTTPTVTKALNIDRTLTISRSRSPIITVRFSVQKGAKCRFISHCTHSTLRNLLSHHVLINFRIFHYGSNHVQLTKQSNQYK